MYLNCHTYFSFKYGTLSVEELFREAQRCGVKKLFLTDIHSTAAYIEMLRICQEKKSEYPLEIALGIEFRRDGQLLYIALAQNNQGFENLNRFLSHHNNSGKIIPSRAPQIAHTFILYPFGSIAPDSLLPNEFIGVRSSQLHRLIRAKERHYPQKLVAWHPVTFRNRNGYNIHRLLRVIDQNTLLSKLPPALQAQPDEIMLPYELLRQHYQHYPALLYNAERITEQCHIHFALGTPKNKKHFYGNRKEDLQVLRSEAAKGFDRRYHFSIESNHLYSERFERELEIIEKKGFETYYLISYDIIQFANRQNYAHVGRGSGANSLIAYCLGITNVDPIELDLYFERFLNPERTSPPDFDIDFSWQDRDHITQYIFDKYGKEHVALLGTHTTYKYRSALRELGKVFGLPKEELDKLATRPAEASHHDQVTRLIFQYANAMQSIPTHLSIHAGGVLITDQPIYAYTTTDLPPKGFPVAHFEMHNAEDLGIFKLDILSQRGLGHIKDATALVKKNQGISIDINDFESFKKDPKIKNLLRKGNTMGCFYVESPAMRMLLGKLDCEDYITLVAASSIIRPGVARSGMMRAYIERHHLVRSGLPYESIHPYMDKLMAETYGVMVYQEDVIKVAHHFAQISLSEADILRRGMSGKFRSRKEFQRVQDRYFENCTRIGYPEHVIARVWYEIESFSGYSFSKGHSASYAVESYQSLYLKAHFPLEFMVGVINNFGGFYRSEFYFHEARMSGATIHAPCINQSEYLTTIKGKDIYIGFIHLKSLETKLSLKIVEERERNGLYKNMYQLIKKLNVGLEQLLILIKIGAFRSFGLPKKDLMWEAHLYFGKVREKSTYTLSLFEEKPSRYTMPALYHHPLENAFDELELLGFPLCNPFELLETSNPGNAMAENLIEKLGTVITILGYLVTTKDTRTKDDKYMHFGTFLDAAGHVFDTVHFPPVAKKYPFRGKGFYYITGKVVEDFSYPMIEVIAMEKIPMIDRRKLITLPQNTAANLSVSH